MRPITPSEVPDQQLADLPEKVIETWNKLIAEAWNGGAAIITIKDAAQALKRATGSDVVRNAWFNVEDVYRKAGWKVEFDRPGFNETYDATMTFTKK